MTRPTDPIAEELAVRRYGLPRCLHVPVAAADEAAITSHVGDIVRLLSGRTPNKAFLVHADPPPPRDASLPIWSRPASAILHQREQVWVHVKYTGYRAAYRRAFPDEPIADKVLSHALNRRIAAHRGFEYVRLTPTARTVNSSSGFSENWGLTIHKTSQSQLPRTRIEYADLCGLMLMMDIRLGGSLMETVNEGQALVTPPAAKP